MVIIIIVLSLALASWIPSLFVFDRIAGELTVLYRVRVFAWKIEWKKVYPLRDIEDVILVTAESYRDGPSDSIRLVIRSKNHGYGKYKRVPMPGWDDYYSIRNEAEVVASFLGLVYKTETKHINAFDC